MTYDQIIKEYGKQALAAGAVGLTQTRMTFWRANGVPLDVQCRFEIVSGGKLKADRKALKAAMK